MKDIATKSTGQIAPQGGADVLQILQSAVERGHDVGVIEKLLDMQERIQAGQARQAFAAAMHEVQSTVRPVRMTGFNDHTRQKYGRLEEMWAEIKPLIDANGFSISFGQQDAAGAGTIRLQAIVRHVGGHSETYHLDLPPDSGGARGGSNKNPIQAIGSSTTYGRRYLISMIFGVVFSSEDNDGESHSESCVTEEQRDKIENLLAECPAGTSKPFLAWLKVARIEDIPARMFETALTNLQRKAEASR